MPVLLVGLDGPWGEFFSRGALVQLCGGGGVWSGVNREGRAKEVKGKTVHLKETEIADHIFRSGSAQEHLGGMAKTFRVGKHCSHKDSNRNYFIAHSKKRERKNA